MKKRLLLMAIFVIALSLLAVFSASAEEYPLVDDLGTPSWYTGNYELMTDKTSKVVLANGDGTYTAYPAYYILKYSITVSNGEVTKAYINNIDYSFVNEKDSKNYSLGAIYKIELPNGLTTVENGIFGLSIKEPNVVEVVMSDSITTIGAHAFRGTTKLKKVVLSKNLTTISSYGFYQARGLEEVIFTSGSNEYLDVSKENIFDGCSALKELDLSTRKIRSLGSRFLADCTVLGKVTLPESLEDVGYCSIYNCPQLYLASSFLPTSLKTAGFHFLSGCPNINSVLYFPEGFEGFTATYNFSSDKKYPAEITLVFLGRMEGKVPLEMVHTSGRKLNLVFTQNTFADLTGKLVQASTDGTLTFIAVTAATDDKNYIEKTGTLEIVLGNPQDATSNKTDADGNKIYNINSKCASIYFCGGDNVEVCYNVRTNVVEGSHANYLTTAYKFDKDAHMSAGVHYDLTEVISLPTCGEDGITESTCVICDRVAEIKAPATGDHTLSEVSACADKCSVCLHYIQKSEQSHKLNKVFTYANGFDAKGAYDNTCTNEGCTYHAVGELDALFACQGYSAPEDGRDGLAIGFNVNNNAIKEYEEATGKSLKYGVFAALKDKLGDSYIFDKDGNAVANSVVAEVSDDNYVAVEFKITGFTDTYKDIKLAMGVYVITTDEADDEATEIKPEYFYLQAGSPNANEKYEFISYNEVVANKKTEA